ncbi:hypothetical protein E2C01_068031 [Portunus trituberculatus]|uniref:Uncharacterized protein n=1 Tax=Portunus trituberculatus TaxID=210409 RepID=A0A5B7HVG3_PORTR|nr:hypothetical protein [Portunus trituberculatus]
MEMTSRTPLWNQPPRQCVGSSHSSATPVVDHSPGTSSGEDSPVAEGTKSARLRRHHRHPALDANTAATFILCDLRKRNKSPLPPSRSIFLDMEANALLFHTPFDSSFHASLT